MFSYLQSKFTVPIFLQSAELPVFEKQALALLNEKSHIILNGKNSIALKREVLSWISGINQPVVWMQLDALDTDPGRFWSLFVYGLRRHYPELGKNFLAGISDHHFSPNAHNLRSFGVEISRKPLVIVFSGCANLMAGPLRNQLSLLMETADREFVFVFLNEHDEELFDSNRHAQTLTLGDHSKVELKTIKLPEHRNFLSVLDVWWVDWLLKNNWITLEFLDLLNTRNSFSFLSDAVLIPTHETRAWLRDWQHSIDYEWMNDQFQNLVERLEKNGNWLEAFRWVLFIKDFEAAGTLLEKYGFLWLKDNQDPLTLLFWLRELPSVLLTARPVPAFLAAESAFRLGLSTQAKFYLAHAENNLAALARFSRSPAQFAATIISDSGLTASELTDKINQLKQKLGTL